MAEIHSATQKHTCPSGDREGEPSSARITRLQEPVRRKEPWNHSLRVAHAPFGLELFHFGWMVWRYMDVSIESCGIEEAAVSPQWEFVLMHTMLQKSKMEKRSKTKKIIDHPLFCALVWGKIIFCSPYVSLKGVGFVLLHHPSLFYIIWSSSMK